MNQQIKFLVVSAGLHGLLVILVFWLTASTVARKEVVTIDFSLDNSASLCAPEQVKQSGQARLASPPDLPKQIRKALSQQAPAGLPVAGTAAPATADSPPLPTVSANQFAQTSAGQGTAAEIAAGSSGPPAHAVRSVSAQANSDSQTGATGVEQEKKRYLKEHFNYIRDLIIKRLAYPQIARRMEWSGKVVLAFVVDQDGGVRSIHIKESSGYPVLDNSAVDTVKNVAPFPRPPVAAEIVMPVHFRLQ